MEDGEKEGGDGLITAGVGGEEIGGNIHSFSQTLFNLHNPVLMGKGGKGDTEWKEWKRKGRKGGLRRVRGKGKK